MGTGRKKIIGFIPKHEQHKLDAIQFKVDKRRIFKEIKALADEGKLNEAYDKLINIPLKIYDKICQQAVAKKEYDRLFRKLNVVGQREIEQKESNYVREAAFRILKHSRYGTY